ncbi:lysophospholipid acyltransferase family protein [Oleispirillum naphthae]|uniref:lysophospholipid acyltransferase family protein n=1 Tax=Oleispirillum naphthae TaxID=2838853 RepID=UPI00308237A2
MIRSFFFNILYIVWTILLSTGLVLLLPLPRRYMVEGKRLWTGGIVFIARWVAGIRHEVRGLENLPKGPVILAVKHQSAWDTLFFDSILPDAVYVLKKELLSIPFVGWHMRKTEMIALDRSAGVKSMHLLLAKAQATLDAGRQIVIFPEGTRTAPGASVRYMPGLAMLAAAVDAPVVPVALNSGLFWARKAFLKRPGTIIVEFLPPMPRGMERRAFLNELQSRIEDKTRALESEGRKQFSSQ